MDIPHDSGYDRFNPTLNTSELINILLKNKSTLEVLKISALFYVTSDLFKTFKKCRN